MRPGPAGAGDQARPARPTRPATRQTPPALADHLLQPTTQRPPEFAITAHLGCFTPAHEALWLAARRAIGEPAATRELIGVLLLHRHMGDSDVIAGIGAALSVGAHTADVVAVEARKVAQTRAGGGAAEEATGKPGQVPASA